MAFLCIYLYLKRKFVRVQNWSAGAMSAFPAHRIREMLALWSSVALLNQSYGSVLKRGSEQQLVEVAGSMKEGANTKK